MEHKINHTGIRFLSNYDLDFALKKQCGLKRQKTSNEEGSECSSYGEESSQEQGMLDFDHNQKTLNLISKYI